MQIIPVIDLLNGVVVHAKKGERQRYQAIESQLTHSSKPLDIVSALLEYYPFQQLYIADLNAIQKRSDTSNNFKSNNLGLVESITRHYPDLKLWIDAGINNDDELRLWSQFSSNLVLGSENFASIEHYLNVAKQIKSQPVLSLDFMPHGYQGPIELAENTLYWPKNVIMMSLAHVGTGHGVNHALLDKYKPYNGKFNLYAAGGVRGIEDLNALKHLGIHGALIATALHQKQLSYQQLDMLSQ